MHLSPTPPPPPQWLGLLSVLRRWCCCCWLIVLCTSHCLLGFCIWSLFYYALPCVLTGFAIILTRKRELAALLYLSSLCLVIVSVLWLFLVLPLVGLQCVIEKVYLLIILTYFFRNDQNTTCSISVYLVPAWDNKYTVCTFSRRVEVMSQNKTKLTEDCKYFSLILRKIILLFRKLVKCWDYEKLSMVTYVFIS